MPTGIDCDLLHTLPSISHAPFLFTPSRKSNASYMSYGYRYRRSSTKYYKILLPTAAYYKMLHRYYSVLHNTTSYCSVPVSTTKHYTLRLWTTKSYSVLQTATQYYVHYSVLQVLHQYYSALQRATLVLKHFQNPTLTPCSQAPQEILCIWLEPLACTIIWTQALSLLWKIQKLDQDLSARVFFKI